MTRALGNTRTKQRTVRALPMRRFPAGFVDDRLRDNIRRDTRRESPLRRFLPERDI